jgi:hypothetical protein
MIENSFAIPQAACNVAAEHDMKQAHAAAEQLTNWAKTAGVRSDAKPVNFKAVQDHAMDFAKDYAESTFSFAGKLCNARTLQDILALQARFVQDQMQTFFIHTQEIDGLIGEERLAELGEEKAAGRPRIPH